MINGEHLVFQGIHTCEHRDFGDTCPDGPLGQGRSGRYSSMLRYDKQTYDKQTQVDIMG